ncbi:molybdopterin-guanine dinucleotide biosynthesis protein A [Sporocytophaga myxococcoides]|uniref:Molybdopterin-guanine dinucleotide biosynthesis protein A n=1 Tax=Sporocytophaga myxococcoides TaxID=153721 RepID=A0A098L9T1_9BACT|nr:molybdenum cofactor guanylyltransferase [Sporocytophaga myxococcoides]GAL82913.1 molybdopterin-guanine dinucleotide biosynthesis protein A [Sporocytophaga myxococcoides]
MEENIIGVVMAGGLSTRMGQDKGLLIENGQTWAENAFAKLNRLPMEVIVSINENQTLPYSDIFHPEHLITDKNIIEGPLNGILSAHSHVPSKDLFLLACDVRDMSSELLCKIYDAHISNSSEDYDYYILKNDMQEEPLIGIYKSDFLKRILFMAEKKLLVKNSLKYIMTFGRGFYIHLDESEKNDVKNFNTPGDLMASFAIL